MSVNDVEQGDRRSFVATVDHAAGDLTYAEGFFGWVQDDIKAGELGMMILNTVKKAKNVPSTLASGVVVAARPTEMATTLQLLPYAGPTGIGGGGATAGFTPIGRVWETGNASMAPIQLFNPRGA